MPTPKRPTIVLRSALGLAAAFAAIPIVNLAGGGLSDALAIPGGTPRLGADLFWMFVAGVVATACLVRIAAVGKGWHALAFFALALCVDAAGVAKMWNDWPRWFGLGIVLTLPLQVWLGWWLAEGRRRRRKPLRDA